MEAPSEAELNQVRTAAAGTQAEDVVVHWQSAFGLIIIEVRAGQVLVNGDPVVPAKSADGSAATGPGLATRGTP